MGAQLRVPQVPAGRLGVAVVVGTGWGPLSPGPGGIRDTHRVTAVRCSARASVSLCAHGTPAWGCVSGSLAGTVFTKSLDIYLPGLASSAPWGFNPRPPRGLPGPGAALAAESGLTEGQGTWGWAAGTLELFWWGGHGDSPQPLGGRNPGGVQRGTGQPWGQGAARGQGPPQPPHGGTAAAMGRLGLWPALGAVVLHWWHWEL